MKLKEWLARDWDDVENLDYVHPKIRRMVRPWIFQLVGWLLMAAIAFGIVAKFLM